VNGKWKAVTTGIQTGLKECEWFGRPENYNDLINIWNGDLISIWNSDLINIWNKDLISICDLINIWNEWTKERRKKMKA
jgi:hypothetical protein